MSAPQTPALGGVEGLRDMFSSMPPALLALLEEFEACSVKIQKLVAGVAKGYRAARFRANGTRKDPLVEFAEVDAYINGHSTATFDKMLNLAH